MIRHDQMRSEKTRSLLKRNGPLVTDKQNEEHFKESRLPLYLPCQNNSCHLHTRPLERIFGTLTGAFAVPNGNGSISSRLRATRQGYSIDHPVLFS